MWYLLGWAALLLGGLVVFDVLDFFIWGFIALALGALAVQQADKS